MDVDHTNEEALEQSSASEQPEVAEVEDAVAAPVRRPSMFDDPIVKWLSIGLGVVIVLFLSTILSALWLGILGSDVPKTALDRDLQAYSYQTESGSTDPAVWRGYVSALVDSGQLSKAQQVVELGLEVVDNRAGQDMQFAQTQVYYSSGKYQQAVDEATAAMKALNAYHEAQLKVEKSPESKGEPISENYWGILYLRARSYMALGEWDKALEDWDTYLDERGGASDSYVLRGDVKAELGDAEGAEADYRTALKFIEDYQPALEGLEKLGVKE